MIEDLCKNRAMLTITKSYLEEIIDNQFLQGKIISKPNHQRDFYTLNNNIKDTLREPVPDFSFGTLLINNSDSLSFLKLNTDNVKLTSFRADFKILLTPEVFS